MREQQKRLRFVTFLAPQIHDVYASMVRYVGETLETAASLEVGEHDYRVFERQEADFGFI